MNEWYFRNVFDHMFHTFLNFNKTFSANINLLLNLGSEFSASFSALGFLSQKDLELEKNLSLSVLEPVHFIFIQASYLQVPATRFHTYRVFRSCKQKLNKSFLGT